MNIHFSPIKLITLLSASFLLSVLSINGQSCLTPDSYSRPHFPQGSEIVTESQFIYYSFENIPPGQQRTQIETAISNWNNALNSNAGRCILQRIVPGPTPSNGVSLTFRNGLIRNFGAARFDETSVYNNVIYSAVITFNPNLIINGIRFYDPNQPGYDTIYVKNTMHELGHGFGMNHYANNHPNACTDQIAQSSVPNRSIICNE